MYLRSVELINWRSYRHARFEFPRPHGSKNVILIYAPNEYGKTSFFEAITLGLFGRDGLGLIPRARAGNGSDALDRLKASYSKFLSNALHRRATVAGPANSSVMIEVEDDDGDPIELRRTWHFRADGVHKVGDDSLEIFHGIAREPVAPPAGTSDRDNWYRDWITQRFIHSSLAEFFLFDGEQVQRYANREMSDQVRRGIEGLLGLPILRNLEDSLAKYAQNRRTSAAAPSDSTVKTVEAEIAKLEEEIAEQKTLLNEAELVLPDLENEIEDLTQSLGGKGEGTMAMVGNLMTSEQRFREEAGRALDALQDLVAGDVAMGIAGCSLRANTKKQLEAESIRERWETGRNEGGQNLERFAIELGERIKGLVPPLNPSCRDAVIIAAKDAWEALWYPPPEGCSDDYLHAGLTSAMRLQVISKLESIDSHTVGEIAGHADRFNSAVSRADEMRREWQDIERTAPETEKLAKKLQDISDQRAQFTVQKQNAGLAINSKEAELADKRAELGRYVSRLGASAPAIRRAQCADDYAALIKEILKEALPSEVSDVAKEMTKAWKAMAHMSDRVDHIEISPTCEVRMLTAKGEDIHSIDKSAGASQVFTQALIAAITKVSGRTFPFLVDTPLARLSKKQRLGVLKTFTDRAGQVIFLSTDEEVIDDKLDAIRERVLAAYELRISHDSGVSVTTVHNLNLRDL